MDFVKKLTLSTVFLLHNVLNGVEEPFALIGGEQGQIPVTPYAAVVSLSSATTTPLLSPLPMTEGHINGVAVNGVGQGIIGGSQASFTVPYAVLVSPSGATIPIMGMPMAGDIQSVAINRNGLAFMGGLDSDNNLSYMAFVQPSGMTTQLIDFSNVDTLLSVALNDSGYAIAGGPNSTTMVPYIVLIDPMGMLSYPMGQTPMGDGSITGVAINNSEYSIVCGLDNNFNDPYVAVIDPMGAATEVMLGATLPNAVAINDAGLAIVGGRANIVPYAAFVTVSPVTVQTVSGLPSTGNILTVDINSSGVAIIGGDDIMGGDVGYAAFVSPSGVATQLMGLPPAGFSPGKIYSVAISESGAALIGGNNTNATASPYAALVSPSGIVTPISGLPAMGGNIRSVAIAGGGGSPILEAIVPKSFGPGSSFANSVFALTSQVLPNHITHWNGEPPEQPKKNKFEEIGLLAAASDKLLLAPPRCMEKPTYALWANFFGEYANQQKERVIPSISNWIAGAMLAFDYLGIRNTILGAGAAYAYNYAKLGSKTGHANTNQEFFTVYGAWRADYIFIHAALWGGLYQMRNTRHSILNITSTSHVDGWLLTPHFEISSPIYTHDDTVILEPFAMFDYANNWQGRVRERGASGFNLRLDRDYTSILRSEVGVRFYETLRYGWGNLILQEKGSYINKAPFQTSASSAFFVGSISSFTVETFSSRMQNLGAVQFNATFIPCKLKYPYGSLNYQGEFGSSFQSHLVNIEIGKYF